MRNTLRHPSLGLAFTCVTALLTAFCSQTHAQTAPAGAAPKAHIAWDWTGIIGTGQSLAVGARAPTVASITQPYHNMMLSKGKLSWPIDPNAEELKLVPLVEPAGRKANGYPSAWPGNLDGETPHSSMGNTITALTMAQFNRDLISIHTEVGENGQGMKYLKKNPDKDPRNVNGHAFEGSLVETKAIARLAKAAGKTFGVGAIIVTHGETDSGNAQYDEMLHQLWQDYSTDIAAITGQTERILMIVSQQNSGNGSPATLAIWRAGDKFPTDIVCSGPKYQYPSPDAVHLTTEGYRLLGEKYGEVYFERVVLGHDWRPLEPTKVTREGKTLTVQFHVPVGPLVWDDALEAPHNTVAEWKNGKGFEVSTGKTRVTIESAEIKGDSVVLTCATDPGAGTRVSYALNGERTMAKPYSGFGRWGLLRDSDPFKGVGTGKVQPNYAVAFEMAAP